MSWSTQSEETFLKGIGTWNRNRNRNRKRCLEGYIKAAKNRDDWESINKTRAIKFAKQLLKYE